MSIALRHITLAYGQRILLRDVSASVPPGSLTALIGRNGTGKSTLLRTVAGLGAAASGGIELCGKPLAALTPLQRASTVSFVTTDKVRIANLACEDVVALGRAPYTNWIGRMQETDRDIVARSLRLVGMEAFACKTMDRMSDGECQRILIARALAQDTPVILLDEPTAFLDLPNRYELATLLRRLAHDEGKCILFSTHDLVRPRDADDPAHKKVTNSIFFGFFFVRLTFLFTFAPLKLPLQGAAIVVKAHSSIG